MRISDWSSDVCSSDLRITTPFISRQRLPGHVMVERSVGPETLAELRRRGHEVEEAEEWKIGRLTAAKREQSGLLKAAATPRLMQAYAIGRSEEHTSELQSLMRISYAVFCLKKKIDNTHVNT